MDRQLCGWEKEHHTESLHEGGIIALFDLKTDRIIELSHSVSQILSELSGDHLDESKFDDFAKQFKSIYECGYRQRYSEILGMLEDITSCEGNLDELNDESEDCLEVISSNLMALREYLRENIEEYGESTYYGVFKLSDHVDIEIHRLRDRQNLYHELSGTDDNLFNLYKKAEKLERRLEKAKKSIEDAQHNSERLQMQMVAILGIFAAIVMAFSGGLDILSGAISISGESDLFRVVFVVILCGIILFNIFAFLMHMILAIIDSSNVKTFRRFRYMANETRKERLSTWLDKFVGSRFIIAFNAILLSALTLDVVLIFIY